MNFLMIKKDVSGKMEAQGKYNLTDTFCVKLEGFMPNEQVETAHMALDFVKEFNDCHLSYKFA